MYSNEIECMLNFTRWLDIEKIFKNFRKSVCFSFNIFFSWGVPGLFGQHNRQFNLDWSETTWQKSYCMICMWVQIVHCKTKSVHSGSRPNIIQNSLNEFIKSVHCCPTFIPNIKPPVWICVQYYKNRKYVFWWL